MAPGGALPSGVVVKESSETSSEEYISDLISLILSSSLSKAQIESSLPGLCSFIAAEHSNRDSGSTEVRLEIWPDNSKAYQLVQDVQEVS